MLVVLVLVGLIVLSIILAVSLSELKNQQTQIVRQLSKLEISILHKVPKANKIIISVDEKTEQVG